jgi:hypothetical protein
MAGTGEHHLKCNSSGSKAKGLMFSLRSGIQAQFKYKQYYTFTQIYRTCIQKWDCRGDKGGIQEGMKEQLIMKYSTSVSEQNTTKHTENCYTNKAGWGEEAKKCIAGGHTD